MEKYGPPAAGVAFVSDTLGSVSDRTANVYDPRLKMEDRIKSGGMVVLDVASGGRGSGVKNLGKMEIVPSALQKLNKVSEIFNVSPKQIIEKAKNSSLVFTDNAHNGNINIFMKRFDGAKGYIRITVEPTFNKIISAGMNQQRNIENSIKNGRFTPLK